MADMNDDKDKPQEDRNKDNERGRRDEDERTRGRRTGDERSPSRTTTGGGGGRKSKR